MTATELLTLFQSLENELENYRTAVGSDKTKEPTEYELFIVFFKVLRPFMKALRDAKFPA